MRYFKSSGQLCGIVIWRDRIRLVQRFTIVRSTARKKVRTRPWLCYYQGSIWAVSTRKHRRRARCITSNGSDTDLCMSIETCFDISCSASIACTYISDLFVFDSRIVASSPTVIWKLQQGKENDGNLNIVRILLSGSLYGVQMYKLKSLGVCLLE